MKNYVMYFVFAIIAISTLSSCEQDTFTEEDAMKALQEVDLIISVTDQSNNNQPVNAATVSTVIDGTTLEKTTDTTGTVIFENVKIGGFVNVYVKKENYTTTYSTINTTPSDYRQSTVSGNISIYSLADENVATVKGQVTIETDLTNRTREYVSGVEVRAFNNSLPQGSPKAFVGITDSEGNYEIKVPVNSSGTDDIYVEFTPTIEADRTAGVKQNNIYSVETKKAVYEPNNYSPTYIYAIPSAVINIEAPNAVGTGFAITTEVDTSNSTLSTSTSNWTILNAGSGYFPNISGSDTSLWVFFSPDTEGLDTARIYLTFEKNGGLTNIGSISNYGNTTDRTAKYSSKPTLDLNIGGGSGASIHFDFQLYYYVNISNNGSGYTSLPSVKKTYVSNGIEYTNTYSLGSYAFISDGSIYSYTQTNRLSTEGRYNSVPEFTIIENTSNQAIAYFTTSDINTDGTISDGENWVSYGSSYDPANAPAVTITALAGYGAGATFYAEVGSDGVIDNLERINAGSGYVRNINDFEGNGSLDQSGDSGSINEDDFYNILPGDVLISNAYYGTGDVKED